MCSILLAGLLILMHVKRIAPYLYIQPSSEDLSWGSKHVVDIKIKNLKY